jgi:hypothetical protein
MTNTGRAISLQTYKMFAKRYKIRLSYMKNNKRINKTMRELAVEIYDFEMKNIDDLESGLYIID